MIAAPVAFAAVVDLIAILVSLDGACSARFMGRIASPNMLPNNFPHMTGAQRYRAAGRCDKGRILDELMSTTGWHREHAVRALRSGRARSGDEKVTRRRGGRYSAIRDKLMALWEASDRVCGKRPDAAGSTRAAWPITAFQERGRAGAFGERRAHRPVAWRGERCSGGWPAPAGRFLFCDPPRGADPHIQ